MSFASQWTKTPNKQQARPILVVEDPKGKRIINLDKNIYSLGRDSKNSIVIHSRLVSRHHATLLRVSNPETHTESFQIIDGDLQGNLSTNGLIINEKHCLSHTLQHKDAIEFGGNAQASYLVIASNLSELEIFEYYEISNLLDSEPGEIDAFQTLTTDNQVKPLSEAALLRLASFPELLPSPIIEIDLAGKITYLNPAANIIFPELQEAELNHPILAGLLEAVKTEKKQFFAREVEIETAIFEQSVHYIAESRLIRSYLVDITLRKQDEQRLRKWADIFQHTGQGLIIPSAGTEKLEMINPALAKMHGYTVEELTGRPISTILAPECQAEVLETIRSSYQKEYYSFEAQHVRKNQIVFPVFVDATNVKDEYGNVLYSIVNIQDITERKLAEEEIFKALAKERDLNELKSSFISIASHELRSPLATILSSTELIEHYSHKLREDEKQKRYKQIGLAIRRMTQLLDDVLAISKAEAGKIEFKPAPLNLEEFCRELVSEVQLTAGNKHEIVFTSSGCSKDVVADENLLQHIFSNLLSNAIKYSPSGGIVEFSLSCEDRQATFLVKDSGIGIPQKDLQKLFSSFHRASNVGTIPGTGLGLSIVKRMVELHGGYINAHSEVGVGTTFTVTIGLMANC